MFMQRAFFALLKLADLFRVAWFTSTAVALQNDTHGFYQHAIYIHTNSENTYPNMSGKRQITITQAKPPAEAFIGYGGVTVRDAVRKGADWFVTDFTPLIRAIREDGA